MKNSKIIKRISIFMLILAVFFNQAGVSALAVESQISISAGDEQIALFSQETEASGTLGDNGGFHWTYNTESKELRITGTDTGLNGLDENSSPLKSICNDVVKIDVVDCRILGSADYLFSNLPYLENVSFTNCDVSQMTSMKGMFYQSPNLRTLDLSTWNTQNVTDMSLAFSECDLLYDLDLSNFNTSKVVNMEKMFSGCDILRELDVEGWSNESVISMEQMFSFCPYLAHIDLHNFKTSNVQTMRGMFVDCYALTDLDVSGFNTSNVKGDGFRSMFEGCRSLQTLDLSNFDTSKATTMENMLSECVNLVWVDVSSFNTSLVESFRCMFNLCHKLERLDLSGFDTSCATNMALMFQQCDSLIELDVSKFDTSRVTDMAEMFIGCYSLTNLDVSNFDTSHVTNMSAMFMSCSGLKALDIGNFDTSHIASLASMFYGCTELTYLDLSNFDTSRVTDMHDMFAVCKKLESVNLESFDTTHVSNLDYMFSSCYNLKSLDLSRFDLSNATTANHMLWNCDNLRVLQTPRIINADLNIELPYTMYGSQGQQTHKITREYCNTTLWDEQGILDQGQFIISVIDSAGIPISGAEVVYSRQKGLTGEDGKVIFTMAAEEDPIIHVKKQGYLSWNSLDMTSNDRESVERGYEIVTLRAAQTEKLKLYQALYQTDLVCCDVLTYVNTINLKRNDIADLTSGNFDLVCKAYDVSKVKEYQILQNGTFISSSKDGIFHLSVDQGFKKGGNCYVTVIGTDGSQECTPINLNFVENEIKSENKVSMVKDKFSVAVKDDVPFLGGSEFNVSMPDLPLEVWVTDELVHIGINTVIKDSSDEEGMFESLKKKINVAKQAGDTVLGSNAREEMEKLINQTESFQLPTGKYEIGVVGYAEAKIGSNVGKGELYIYCQATTTTYGFTTWVVVVPVTVQIGATLKLEGGGELSWDIEKMEAQAGIDVDFSVKVDTLGGIGIGKAVGAGVYGNGDLSLESRLLGTDSGLKKIDLTGEMGIKIYVGPLSYEKAFAHNTWHLYTGKAEPVDEVEANNFENEMQDASCYSLDNIQYVNEESDWQGNDCAIQEVYTGMRVHNLLEHTYKNAQPVMVSTKENVFAAFLRADSFTGEIYVACTKMENGTWMSPKRVDNTDTMDDAPQLMVSKDGTIWLVYAKTRENADISTLSGYASNQNIVVGKINPDTMEFELVEEFICTGYAHMPKIALVNSVPTIIWVESPVTDDESVLSPARCVIKSTSYIEGAWNRPQKIYGCDDTIMQIALGNSGFACNTKSYSDQEDSTGEFDLIICDWNGNEQQRIPKVKGKITYDVFPGTSEEKFIWNDVDKIVCDNSEITIPGVTDEYVIVDDKIYYGMCKDGYSQLVEVVMNADGTLSNPVCLTEGERYLENLSVTTVNDVDVMLGMHTMANILENSVDTDKNLICGVIQPVTDISISDLSYDANIDNPGENVPINITVKNIGNSVVNKIHCMINNVEIATKETKLSPGQSAELSFDIIYPNILQEYDISVAFDNVDIISDNTPDNNKVSIKLGQENLAVKAELLQFGDTRKVIACVRNEGNESTGAVIKFVSEDGTLLKEENIGGLKRGDISILELCMGKDLSDVTITVLVETGQEELYTYDNYDTVYVPSLNEDNPGGDNPGGDNPGGDNPGGDNPGGDNPGGDNPGGDNPGGDNPGGDNPGEDNPGGDNPGGDNPGGDNPGGDNPGGDNPGGDNPGGGNPGRDNPGGDNPGGGNPGGDNPGENRQIEDISETDSVEESIPVMVSLKKKALIDEIISDEKTNDNAEVTGREQKDTEEPDISSPVQLQEDCDDEHASSGDNETQLDKQDESRKQNYDIKYSMIIIFILLSLSTIVIIRKKKKQNE